MSAVTQIFDASLQKSVDHTLEIDANGEVVATSTESGRQIKFPAGLTKSDFEKAVADHEESNSGHQVISPEELEAQDAARKKSESLLEYYDDGSTPAEDATPEAPADEDNQ